jgi:peptidoglycan/LPS O-acetylase OafA/YrhL
MSTLLVSTLQPRTALQPSSATRIPTLDGWRGVAILLVLLEHAGQYGRFKDQMWTNLGSFGVDIFFVLSGYIITTRLIKERALHGRINLRGFYLRRAFRILPLVVIYLSALCLISRFTYLADFRWQEVAGSLFFFRNYQFAADPRGIYTTHFWSLSIEEHFYLVWPALFLVLGNRRALWFATAGASASAFWRLYELSHSASAMRALQTDARLDGLLLGAALALLLTHARVQAFIFANFQREMPLLLLPAIFINLLLAHNRPSFTSYLLIVATLAYTIIVKQGTVFWWLNLRPIVWIGEISYSLYIWQQIFLLHPVGLLPLGRLSVFPFNLACALVAATCSFYFIERPAIELGKRLYARKVYDPPPPDGGAAMMI